MIKSKPKSIVTQPPGGSSASPAGQSFAASLRSEKKNNDVYIKIPPRSPQLNPSENMWKEIREKFFYNRIFNSIESLSDRISKAIL